MSNAASSSFTSPSVPNNAASTIDDGDEARHKLRAQQGRRALFLDDMIRSIDIAIYCQLSVLYYMEYVCSHLLSQLSSSRALLNIGAAISDGMYSCSLLRFLLRVIPHWVFFSPKPAFLPPLPRDRPFASAILVTNSIALALHLFLKAPEAGESVRGYLHGGLLIDFVGELGPISKSRLALFDLLTIALQLIILPAVLERRDLKNVMEESLDGTDRPLSDGLGSMQIRQDIDAEEQGIHRSEFGREEDIELKPLSKDTARAVELNPSHRRTEHHMDVFYSGQLVVADLHVLDAVRVSWRAHSRAAR